MFEVAICLRPTAAMPVVWVKTMDSPSQILWFMSRHRLRDSGERREPPEAMTYSGLAEQTIRYSVPLSVSTRYSPEVWEVSREVIRM